MDHISLSATKLSRYRGVDTRIFSEARSTGDLTVTGRIRQRFPQEHLR